MDWGACIICQKVTEKPLRCPQASPTADGTAPYKIFLDYVNCLRQLKILPAPLIIDENSALDDSSEQSSMAQVLSQNV